MKTSFPIVTSLSARSQFLVKLRRKTSLDQWHSRLMPPSSSLPSRSSSQLTSPSWKSFQISAMTTKTCIRKRRWSMSLNIRRRRRLSFANSGSVVSNVSLDMIALSLMVSMSLLRRHMLLLSTSRPCAKTSSTTATAFMAIAANLLTLRETSLTSSAKEKPTKTYSARTPESWTRSSTQSLIPTSRLDGTLLCHQSLASLFSKTSAKPSGSAIKSPRDKRKMSNKTSRSSPRKLNTWLVSVCQMAKMCPLSVSSSANDVYYECILGWALRYSSLIYNTYL